MKITIFSSGSSGNCTLVQTNNLNILIDVGISKKMIEENLSLSNLKIDDIDIILLTHEHADHIKAFNSLIRYEHIQIFLSNGTYEYILKSNELKSIKCYEMMKKRVLNGSISILKRIDKSIYYPNILLNDLVINVLPTFHDASESIGFVINENNKKIVYITDTGYVHQSLYPLITNAECYILESNHDPAILMHSNRPHHLKMRILSNHGHMSNEDSMVTLAHVMGQNTRIVMHAHISQECNLTQIVEMTRIKVLNDYGINTNDVEFVITSPFRGKEFEI